MTLLVLDIHLPEDLKPADSAQLWQGVIHLGPKLFVYALSFVILGLRWLSVARIPSRAEYLEGIGAGRRTHLRVDAGSQGNRHSTVSRRSNYKRPRRVLAGLALVPLEHRAVICGLGRKSRSSRNVPAADPCG
jgi:hypothetical protein